MVNLNSFVKMIKIKSLKKNVKIVIKAKILNFSKHNEI